MKIGSWIRRMFEEGIAMKKQYGAENVIDLSLGNPIMEPPPEFKAELRRVIDNPFPGMHGYMANAGYPETRAAIAAQLERETGVKVTEKEVIMAVGAAGAINVALKTILDPGDEVIVFLPWFVDYFNYIQNHDGVVKVVPTDEGFMPKLDELEAAIGPRTKGILIDSPNNPTGVVYGKELMQAMGDLLRRKEEQYGKALLQAPGGNLSYRFYYKQSFGKGSPLADSTRQFHPCRQLFLRRLAGYVAGGTGTECQLFSYRDGYSRRRTGAGLCYRIGLCQSDIYHF